MNRQSTETEGTSRVEARSSLHAEQAPRLYRVPECQRMVNPAAYRPYFFFFGPYRVLFQVQEMVAMEEGDYFKRQAASRISGGRKMVGELAREIETKHYAKTKALYAQLTPSHWDRVDWPRLAEEMAFDALAIVAAVVKSGEFCGGNSSIAPLQIANDAVLLENQIPLDLLETAFTRLGFDKFHEAFEKKVVCEYTDFVNPFPDYYKLKRDGIKGPARDCLLGAIYDYLNRSDPESTSQSQAPSQQGGDGSALFTASHLARCGIRCKPHACDSPITNPAIFAAIHFDSTKKVLQLPTICVGDHTVRFLHNLLAYEATCRYPRQKFVTSYCYIMDGLINTAEDVEVLVKAKVIKNLLGSSGELAAAWNKLCAYVGIGLDDEVITNVISKVNESANRRWPRWRASFMETYWEKKPWLLASIVIGAILFALTILQAIYTIKTGK